jgi:hypothetical protein
MSDNYFNLNILCSSVKSTKTSFDEHFLHTASVTIIRVVSIFTIQANLILFSL